MHFQGYGIITLSQDSVLRGYQLYRSLFLFLFSGKESLQRRVDLLDALLVSKLD